jgi:hypothetical protein
MNEPRFLSPVEPPNKVDAVLVLIPRTATLGLTMLADTMFGAVVIVALVLGHRLDSLFPGMFLMALAGVAASHSRNCCRSRLDMDTGGSRRGDSRLGPEHGQDVDDHLRLPVR